MTCRLSSLEPNSFPAHLISMDQPTIFNEKYRVIAVDDQSLILRGIHSGELLTINHVGSDVPLSQAEFAVGQLVALNDPSSGPVN